MSLHRVTITQLILGQRAQNVIHLDNPDGTIEQDAIAQLVEAHWVLNVRVVQGTGLLYTSVAVQDVSTPLVAPVVRTMNFAGTLGGFAIKQPFLAMVYRLLTATAGRKGRGRVMFAGCNEQSIDATGLWSITGVTNPFQVLRNKLFDAFVSNNGGAPLTGLNLMLVSRASPDGPNPRAVNNIVVRALPGTQNSRKIGVGL